MRLKSFHAKTMTEAMQMVRDALGEDAIIISTRDDADRKGVTLTAAIEEDRGFLKHAPKKLEKSHLDKDIAFDLRKKDQDNLQDDWLQYDAEDRREDLLSEVLVDSLFKHHVPEDLMDEIIGAASMVGVDQPSVALVGAFATLFNFMPLPTLSYKKALMLVGTPGAGKTLTLAKLATRAVMNDLQIAILTCDTLRAGGVEQLQAYVNILNVPLHKIKNPKDLKEKLQSLTGYDQILIDTPGVNPFDANEMKDISQLVKSGDVEPVLVLPAGLDADESGEIARLFTSLGTKRLILSRVDSARRHGGLLTAAYQAGLSFADLSDTPQIADGLTPVSPRLLASLFVQDTQKSSTLPQPKTSSKISRKKTG
jgi:flagellar biosynthesis protein FlhF